MLFSTGLTSADDTLPLSQVFGPEHITILAGSIDLKTIMLGYCRLISLIPTKGTHDDLQADYLPFYSIHCAGADARRDEKARIDSNKGADSKPYTDPAGNASIIIEPR
jgi:hypothetical protein